MWDPRTYEDTDYGLDEGERFEPDLDLDDEPFDRSIPHIMTILGPIEPEELGVCLPATRFLPEPAPGQSDRERTRLLAGAADELEAFASVGGRSVVDIATAVSGRDVPALQRLTQLVPSHLIAAAGFPAGGDDAIAGLERELQEGLDGTGVQAGLIAVRARDLQHGDVLEATVAIALRDGLPLLVEVATWEDGAPVLAARAAAGAAGPVPSLILAGPPSLPDPTLVAEASAMGAFLTLRSAGPGHPRDEAALAAGIAGLVGAGLGPGLLVTLDLVMPRVRMAGPAEPRAPYLIDHLAIALMEAGIAAPGVRRLMIENPAQALTVMPTPEGGERL